MTKHFCDLCGAPADDGLVIDPPRAALPVGEPWTDHGPMPPAKIQCYAVASVRFTFVQHKTGFGSPPPDLCRPCAAKIVRQILDRLEPPQDKTFTGAEN